MTPHKIQKLEEVLNELQNRLTNIPHINLRRNTPPTEQHYTQNQYSPTEGLGKVINKPTGEKLFIPAHIYQKIMTTIKITKDNETIYAHTKSGTHKLHAEDILALGTISHFLDEKPQYI